MLHYIRLIFQVNSSTVFIQDKMASSSSSPSSSPSLSYTILFHGNCIDGWFSAYIAHSSLKLVGTVAMYPISPNQQNTWPSAAKMSGTHVLLLDVSLAKVHRDAWTAAGVASISCIDHHASAMEHWSDGVCPIDTTSCAAIQTWRCFVTGMPIPFWLAHIDRIDRWDNPTYEDRCVREVLNVIAHKPVQQKMDEAFALTESFLMSMNAPLGIMTIVAQGKQILDQKDGALLQILARGSIQAMTQEHVVAWKLPAHWLGTNVFIIDNTNITLDSTEAAHIVFLHYPQVGAFVNYRKKVLYGRGSMAVEKEVYTYSARSRGFDLTHGESVLKGHPTSAGASLVKGEVPVLPFVLTSA